MIRTLWYRFVWWSDQRLRRLGRRETWLLAVALVAVIGAAQYLTTYSQGWLAQGDVTATLNRQANERAELENRLADLRAQVDNPREAELQSEIRSLRAEISDVNAAIERMTDAMVPPAEMIRVVRQLLDTRDDLTLEHFETLPVSRTTLQASAGSAGSTLYKHSISLQLSGTFNALAAYIRTVEVAAWQIYWEDLEFTIDEYPIGEARITVYTLSNDAGWLDV